VKHSDTGEERSLPDGWIRRTLAEVCEVNPRMARPEKFSNDTLVSFVPMAAVDDVKGAIVAPEIRPIEEVWRGYTRFAEGDVIFAKITPCMENGKAAIADKLMNGIGLGSTEFHVLRPSEAILPEWIYHFVRQSSFRRDAAARMTGTAGQLRVPTAFMREAPIPIAPPSEQRRILAEIETQFTRLDAAVAALQRAQATLQRYKASVLKSACEGHLLPEETVEAIRESPDYEPADQLLARILVERRAKWEEQQWQKEIDRAKKRAAQAIRKAAGLPARIRDLTEDEWQHLSEDAYAIYLPKSDKWKQKYKDPESPETDDLPQLPDGWMWVTVEQVGALGEQPVLTGPFGTTLGRSDFLESGVPVLTIGCLTDQGLSTEKANFVSDEKAADLERYRVKAGDLLFSRMATVGRADVVSAQFEGALINYHLMRLRLANQAIHPVFFISYVRGSGAVVDYLEEIHHGVTRPGINTKQLLAMPVSLPPLGEQQRIVEEVERRLSVVSSLEAAVQANLRRAERLRQSILKRAFEGRLVPQDPDDEPASMLLERIRAERRTEERPRSNEAGRKALQPRLL
jgi:type I restriction enzyme S subunit